MKTPRVVAVIQARMGSTRLPGKILLEAAGAPVLGHVIRRVASAEGVDRVVVATSTLAQDDPVVAAAAAFGAETTRGPEEDVLARFDIAFREHGGEIGVRVTADCPLFDGDLLSKALRRFQAANPPLDYLSNTLERTYPRGYDLEIFRVAALRAAAHEATQSSAREHVTPFLYRHPNRFRTDTFTRPDPLGTADWRLTLDTPEDWKVLRHVLERLAPRDPFFGVEAVEALIAAEPDIVTWNRNVEQKAH